VETVNKVKKKPKKYEIVGQKNAFEYLFRVDDM